FLFIIPRPPLATLFPYTTLFRSSRRNIYTVEYCVGGKLLGQAVDQLLRTADVTDSCQHSCGYVSGSSIVRCTESLIRRSAGKNRSEEHTSELQSLAYLVCRLLLE